VVGRDGWRRLEVVGGEIVGGVGGDVCLFVCLFVFVFLFVFVCFVGFVC